MTLCQTERLLIENDLRKILTEMGDNFAPSKLNPGLNRGIGLVWSHTLTME